MSQRIRRSLAVSLLVAALPLALPAPSQAAGLWAPAAPTVWMSRAWSWLESLGLVSGKPAPAPRRSAAQREKSGLVAPGDPSTAVEPPTEGGPYQGSGIDPNGLK
jgi:hypothetical protein